MTEKHSQTQADTPHRCALAFDAQEFCHFLADCDWTEAQKREFVEELWKIIVGFVDLGFDLHPIQQVIDRTETLEEDSSTVLGLDNLEILKPKDAMRDRTVCAARTES